MGNHEHDATRAPMADQPPPYNQMDCLHSSDVVRTALLWTLEQQSQDNSQTMTQELQRFLRHVLSIDYQVFCKDSPETSGNWLRLDKYTQPVIDLRSAIASAQPGNAASDECSAKILELTAVVEKQVRLPAQELGLPVDLVLEMMCRYRETSLYSGCHDAILARPDSIRLPREKIATDRNMVIPAAFPLSSIAGRRRMLEATWAVERKCDSMEREITRQIKFCVDMENSPESWPQDSTVTVAKKKSFRARVRDGYAVFKQRSCDRGRK